jgi:hypothetical protein
MKISPQNDKWYINVGKVTREHRDEMIAWCYQCWDRGWGEVDTTLGETVFIFQQLSQANWFMLKWS